MTADKLNPVVLSSYAYGFRRDSHQLIMWGHQDALEKINANSTEEEITGLIVEAVNARFDDPLTPERFNMYAIDDEVHLSVEGRVGKTRRRLDIEVEYTQVRPRPRYGFEAKRLKKNSFPIGRYVGEEGVLCFVRSTYAARYPEAAMLGYVQSGTVEYWSQELKRRFEGDEKNEMRVLKALKQFQIEGCPDILVSEHGRKENVSITLCHLFLDCS